jgi:hypothetical protein
MLVRSTPERALGALLGGESTAATLYMHVTELSKVVTASVCTARGSSDQTTQPTRAVPARHSLKLGALREELRRAIQVDVDQRTSRNHRMNESQLAAFKLCDDSFLESPEIPALDELANAVLVNTGNDLHVRGVQVQRYAEVLSELDPTLLVAWHLVKRTATKGQGKQATLRMSVDRLTSLFVGPRYHSLPFAENHVHLNGITGDELVLAQIILGSKWPEPKNDLPQQDKIQLCRIRRIRRCLVRLTSIWGEDSAEPLVTEAQTIDLLKACWDDADPAAPNPVMDWEFMERGIVIKGEGELEAEGRANSTVDELKQPVTSKWLLRRLCAAARKHELQRAWTWLFILLLHTYRARKVTSVTRAIILLVVADIMVLRRQMLLNGNGLRRFTTEVFHSSLRKEAAFHEKWKETSVRETTRRLFTKPGDKAEIKICSGSLKSSGGVAAFAQAAHERLLSLSLKSARPEEANGAALSRSHWHLCAHFNRIKESSRVELWKKAIELRDILNSATHWDLSTQTSLGIGSGHLVLPAELIRGLDVVGDETRWSIEMFAPMLRWLRSTAVKHDRLSESFRSHEPVLKLHLSIHAGEDYAHPLSGLRHVDEAVKFCEMRAGDRLGHALALGIPPNEWLYRHGETLLSVDEHVDNLVWAWRKAVELRNLPLARSVRPRLESRIARMLPHVSWLPWGKEEAVPTRGTLMHLYQAWELRRNCAYMATHEAHAGVGDSKLDVGMPDLQRLHKQISPPSMATAEGLYLLRARHLESKSPIEKPKGERQVRLTVMRHHHVTRGQKQLESSDSNASAYLHDHDDSHDLNFMLAIQDACIESYAKLGLAIEANPSSNVYIGQLQTHSDHPIYRWNPPNPEDLNEGARFNKFNLRKRPMPVTVNTDDPGMIPTTLRMEHHLIHEAAISRGHSKRTVDNWVEGLRQLGMMHFERAH